MYYAAGILASSEKAGGRPGRAWSAPSSSCLGPCSRSLSRANTPSPRLLHVSLTSFGVYPELPASFGVYPTRCSRAKMYQALPLRFSLSGQRSYAIRCARGGGGAWERGYAFQRISFQQCPATSPARTRVMNLDDWHSVEVSFVTVQSEFDPRVGTVKNQ